MAILNDTTATRMQVSAAPVSPNDVIRRADLDTSNSVLASSIAEKADGADLHEPASGAETGTATSIVGPDQKVNVNVKLAPVTILQEAADGQQQVFEHPVAESNELALGFLRITSITLTRRIVDGADIAVGVDGVDYFLDAEAGTVIIPQGSNLITEGSGEEVLAVFDVAEIAEGPGLEVRPAPDSGLGVKFGTGHDEVSRGDHIHINDHPAAAGVTTPSAVTSVDPYQRISTHVVTDDETVVVGENGVQLAPAVMSRIAAIEDDVEALEQAMASSGGEGSPITVANTPTLALTKDENGQITGVVQVGAGLEEGENGVQVDFDEVAAKNHGHNAATIESDGFMTSAQAAALADHEERLDDAETAISELDSSVEALDSSVGDHETRIDALETAVSDLDSAVDTLESSVAEKADIDDVNAALALKADVSALAGKSDVGHGHAVVTEEAAGFMSPAMLAKLNSLSALGFDGPVNDIAVDGDDLFVVGDFTVYTGNSAPRIARLDIAGRFNPAFQIESGPVIAPDFVARGDGAIFVAGEETPISGVGAGTRAVWKYDDDGDRNTGFTCPEALTTQGEDTVTGLAVMGTKVAVGTPEQLVVLAANGAADTRVNSDPLVNGVLSHGTGILVSTHSYTDTDVAHKFGGKASPKGLKLLNSSLDIEPDWLSDSTAGTGAQASCGRAVLSPDEEFFIVGNALLNFDSPSTAWNDELIGNLLLWSKAFDNATWVKVGSLVVDADTETDADGDAAADTLEDSNGAEHAYVAQEVAIEDDETRYVFSVDIRKDSDTTRFPLIRLEFQDGTTQVDLQVQLNTQTGATTITANIAGFGEVDVEELEDYWRVSLSAQNNDTGNETAVCTIYPAYADTFGGASEAITGSVVAGRAQLRKDEWNEEFQYTEGDDFIPSGSGANSNRFRGLYKIGIDGAEDALFSTKFTLSEQSHVIPFGIASDGKIYCGGPVATIDNASNVGVAVTPWRLYRLTSLGKFDREFSLFNDRVNVARVLDNGNIAVGGEFTMYGQQPVGYFVILTPEGEIAGGGSGDCPIIVATTAPDVAADPSLKDKLWYDVSDPCAKVLKTYNECTEEWEAQGLIGTLPPPSFAPVSGTVDPDEVAISVPGFPSAAIFYTTDGSTPTTSSTLYTGPIDMGEFVSDDGETVVIKAFAQLENYNSSTVATASYLLTAKLPDPVFTPGNGAVTPLMVEIEIPGHEEATIYYTTDGSDPDLSSAVYTGAINVTDATTIKAFGVEDDFRDSDIGSSSYAPADYGSGDLPSPIFTPSTGTQPFPVMVSIAVPGHPTGCTIYYTVDGTEPNYSSPRYEGDPIELDGETEATIKAFATKLTFSPSDVATKVYTKATLAAPTVTPNSGNVELNSTVALTHAVAGVSVYYTTNGTDPTEASTLYTGPIELDTLPLTIKAIAVKDGYQNSAISTAAFTQLQVATPQFSPTPGTVAFPQDVTLTTATAGAEIRYTTNGATPDETSTLYSGPITVSADTTIKAIALKDNYLDSAVASGFYSNNLIAPSISPDNGSTIPDQTAVTLSQVGNPVGTQIYFTLDGSTPDDTKTLYTTPFLINANMTVKAVCVKTGYDDSAVTTAAYTKATVPTPTAAPLGGPVFFPTNLALACSLAGATIHYTTDGDTPTTGDPVYSSPISVSSAQTIKALARKLGYNNSAVMSEAYTQAQAGTPIFDPVAGAYPFPFAVSISNNTANDTIYYTIDGSDPDNTDFEYGAPRKITPNMASNSQDGFTASSPHEELGSAYEAFDGNESTAWHSTGAIITELNITLPLAERVTSYRLKTDRLTSWQFQGKRISDGLWITIHSGSASPTLGVPAWFEFELGDSGWSSVNTLTFREYRIHVLTAASSSSIHELELFASQPTVDEGVTIKAIAIGTGWLDSNIASAAYTQAQVATPTALPVAGPIPYPSNVALSCATSGATIHYTTNGDAPTTGSPVYSSPIAVSADTTIKALAVKNGYLDSGVLSAAYTQQQIVVSFTPAAPASGVTQVAISADVSGSTIYYTVDGSTPDTGSFVYSGPIGIAGETTIKAFAKKTGYLDSAIETGVYNEP